MRSCCILHLNFPPKIRNFSEFLDSIGEGGEGHGDNSGTSSIGISALNQQDKPSSRRKLSTNVLLKLLFYLTGNEQLVIVSLEIHNKTCQHPGIQQKLTRHHLPQHHPRYNIIKLFHWPPVMTLGR